MGVTVAVVIVTDHSAFDYQRIARMALIVDTRNALKGFAHPSVFACKPPSRYA
jgi:UDP-N-acetyl-D-mannosaminuronate dehydrogenase